MDIPVVGSAVLLERPSAIDGEIAESNINVRSAARSDKSKVWCVVLLRAVGFGAPQGELDAFCPEIAGARPFSLLGANEKWL